MEVRGDGSDGGDGGGGHDGGDGGVPLAGVPDPERVTDVSPVVAPALLTS